MAFLSGIVEGFYGRSWSWSERDYFARKIALWGLNTYLYCPKSDGFLRRRWAERAPADYSRNLASLGRTCLGLGLHWGVGLSPYTLYQDYGTSQRQALRQKIESVNELDVTLLAILFDDMPGDQPDLAERQAEILADVIAWTSASRVLMCPTYYSFDPVLEEFFGPRPEGYWESLGSQLDPSVDLFWTGNAVCSATVCPADIEAITDVFGRPVMLWDNYPVNDGARASRYLHLRPLTGRDRELRTRLSGHLCNPMNQATLSIAPLLGLVQRYGDSAPVSLDDWLAQYCSAEFSQQLLADLSLFQDTGLDGISDADRDRRIAVYSEFDDQQAAEVCAWLRGEYTFDPECLTD